MPIQKFEWMKIEFYFILKIYGFGGKGVVFKKLSLLLRDAFKTNHTEKVEQENFRNTVNLQKFHSISNKKIIVWKLLKTLLKLQFFQFVPDSMLTNQNAFLKKTCILPQKTGALFS